MHKCSCLCGEVEFEIAANLKHAINCHCQSCRKAHGAHYVTVLVVLPGNYKFIKGEEHLVRYPKDSSKTGRFVCGKCGSKLFTESAPNLPISVHTSALENEDTVEVMAHTNTESKSPAYIFSDELPKFERCLTKEDYLTLIS